MARQRIDRNRAEARLAGAAWERLAAPEQRAALELAAHQGKLAVRSYLGAQGPSPASTAALRHSPWAREQRSVERLPDDVFLLFATAHTVPTPDDYIEQVVERLSPERASWWWGSEFEERQADPRVWAFCDAYERERCSILGAAPPPTAPVDLQLHLWHAKEEEREHARDWLRTLDTSYSTEEYGKTQRAAAKFEYERCQRVTDLAQMMLDLAAHRDPQSRPSE
jgi:hypothetical protein